VQTLRLEEAPDAYRNAWIQALGPDGNPMRGLRESQFILWEGQRLAIDYEVTERNTSEVLAVGFALCRDNVISEGTLKIAREAVLGCLEQKRPEHHWAIAQFVTNEAHTVEAIEAAHCVPDAARLQGRMAEAPLETKSSPAMVAALKSLLPAVLKVRGRRHLILLSGGDPASAPEMEAQAEAAVADRVAIHAVVVGNPGDALKSICQRTQGMIVAAADATEVAAAFRKLYLALTQRYEVRYRSAPEQLPPSSTKLEIYCSEGRGECAI